MTAGETVPRGVLARSPLSFEGVSFSPYIPRLSRGDDPPTVAFTPTTDRPTDAVLACTAAVTWLTAIPHLISVTVGQPGSSLVPVTNAVSQVSDPRVSRCRTREQADLELPHFFLEAVVPVSTSAS